MSDYRLGDETPPLSRRSSRVYEEDGGWFFTTREGKPMGPFESEGEATQGLADFIEFIELAPLDVLASLTTSLSEGDDADSSDTDKQ
ncbi:MAG: hypothetical protein JJU22_03150 [Gammaproteobacteria bacterium]|nr:hypothetical protein [Gammaproteobacteria bacterium]